MKHAFAAFLLAWLPLGVQAQESCPDRSAYAPAREIIADLGRITAPTGVQEAYAVEIGGIRQWVNVRGQDRDNPMVLFVHGGPASPIIPTLWQCDGKQTFISVDSRVPVDWSDGATVAQR